MKVLHIPFCFYPDAVGGTEVYVEALARELRSAGWESVVAAPGDRAESYRRDGLAVRRVAVGPVRDPGELYGAGDAVSARGFLDVLDEDPCDLVHMHAYTRSSSLDLARAIRRRGVPVVFTYHTPAASCTRGTLMRDGREVCDGVLDVRRCTACTLQGLGAGRLAAALLSHVPERAGTLAGGVHLSGGVWTAFRMTSFMGAHQQAFMAFVSEVDALVALSRWSWDVLRANGVPETKLTLSRHGLPARALEHDDDSGRRSSTLRVVQLGRLAPEKGAHVLIAALRLIPEAAIELDLYGVSQGESADTYLEALKSLAQGDPRIRFRSRVESASVPRLLATYDLVAIPSQCLETGPLVALEAFAARVPVVGANLGGIAELVEHEVNGLVVDLPGAPAAWSAALARCAADRNLLARLADGIKRPRTMNAVAREMAALYGETLGARQTGTAECVGV